MDMFCIIMTSTWSVKVMLSIQLGFAAHKIDDIVSLLLLLDLAGNECIQPNPRGRCRRFVFVVVETEPTDHK